MTKIRDEVFRALDTALENGHDPRDEPLAWIVTDLLDKNSALEGVEEVDVRACARLWLGSRRRVEVCGECDGAGCGHCNFKGELRK